MGLLCLQKKCIETPDLEGTDCNMKIFPEPPAPTKKLKNNNKRTNAESHDAFWVDKGGQYVFVG